MDIDSNNSNFEIIKDNIDFNNFKEEVSSADVGKNKKVDILFVVDTSYSMVKHLQNVDKTFKDFIKNLSLSSSKIAFTNADYDPDASFHYSHNLFSGKVMQLELNGRILYHKFLYSYSQYSDRVFIDTLKRYEEGDVDHLSLNQYINPCDLPPYCQGDIKSPVRSLIRAFSVNKDFPREDGAFIVVIFTNGDDIYVEENAVDMVFDAFKKNYGMKKDIRIHSISIIPGDHQCLVQDQSINYSFIESAYGKNIYKLVQATDGKALSICLPDYSSLGSIIVEAL